MMKSMLLALVVASVESKTTSSSYSYGGGGSSYDGVLLGKPGGLEPAEYAPDSSYDGDGSSYDDALLGKPGGLEPAEYAPDSADTEPLAVFTAAERENEVAIIANMAPDSFDPATAATDPPTPVPNPAPAPIGYEYQQQVVNKTVSKLSVKMAFTEDEAKHPTVRKVLEQGFANSLEFNNSSRVKVTKVNGKSLESSRRLSTFTTIEFAVESENADTSQLQANIKMAATSGKLVVAIKKQANKNGVLTPALQAMDVVLLEPTVVDAEVQVVVDVLVESLPTAAPTSAPTPAPTAPTPAPTLKPTYFVVDDLTQGSASAISTSGICLALVLCQAAMLAFV